MFNSISGTITAKFPKQLFLENNGIEWDLCVPDSNLDMLGTVGSEAKVYTWLQHTDTSMALYGFANADERSVFLDLLKVEGVGPKGAVKIMSSVSSRELMNVLESGEVGLLEKIPGVGKKTAGKMMLTLKGKLTLQNDETTVKLPKASPYSDVIDSLVSMGYDRKLTEQKIAQLSAQFNAELNSKNQKEREEFLFRTAIVELA
ncbi:MAG: Holliday junction branch migration protein RuvA [Treponema sp.]|nr:Holliday junction branch migration protein RuvA [Treponema sp.]